MDNNQTTDSRDQAILGNRNKSIRNENGQVIDNSVQVTGSFVSHPTVNFLPFSGKINREGITKLVAIIFCIFLLFVRIAVNTSNYEKAITIVSSRANTTSGAGKEAVEFLSRGCKIKDEILRYIPAHLPKVSPKRQNSEPTISKSYASASICHRLGDEPSSFLAPNPIEFSFEAILNFIFGNCDHFVRKDWSNANFYGIDAAGSSFDYSILNDSDLRKANLQKASFLHSSLSRVDLREANLHLSNLACSNLESAILNSANLSYTDLTKAHLQDALLIGTNLTGANLVGSNLVNADLRFANLEGADLTGSDLSGARLDYAILDNADLTLATLRNTNLFKTEVDKANFMFAFVRGVKNWTSSQRETVKNWKASYSLK